jgi:cyclopropane fatty-acyl-phospholipid synthase-like methyltransferase
MELYNSAKGVSRYIKMAEGLNGQALIVELGKHLEAGATVLELGMGPGKDLDFLTKNYTVTGSDSSSVFLDRYRTINPDADLLWLDAVTIDTDRRFDAIYSNKVLHHLSDEELAVSLDRQATVLTNGGFVMHSFWHGDAYEEYDGMPVYCRNEDILRGVFSTRFDIISVKIYAEMEDGDSIYAIAEARNRA